MAVTSTTLPDGQTVISPSDATRQYDITQQLQTELAKLRAGTATAQTVATIVGALARLYTDDLSVPPDTPPPPAPSPHTHPQSDVVGLGTALAGKSDTSHTHPELPTPGQKNALLGATGTPGTNNEYLTKQSIGSAGTAGKALAADDTTTTNARTPTAHTHAESEVTNLVSDLAGKAAATHTHAESDVTNLVADLAAKAASSSVPNASYRTLLDSSGSHTAARVAGTYGLAQGQPLAISGTGTLYPLNTIYLAAADYPTLNGVAAKLRIRAELYTNDIAPTGNFTVGLHPITRPATSGGAGLCIYTIGAAVTGSAAPTFTAPAADGLLNQVGSDFALPTDGHYVLGVVTTAAVATSAHVHISASLQMRNA